MSVLATWNNPVARHLIDTSHDTQFPRQVDTELPEITFVIPVRNDAGSLARCLASVGVACESIRSEVIVVDNGSTDRSADVGREFGYRVLVAPHLRVSELRNLGAAAARAPILAFVDADHEIASGWARAALDAMKTAIVAAGYPYVPPLRATWVQRFYNGLRTHPPATAPARWLGSGNLAIRTAAFHHVGEFDTRLEACEDVDLCNRLRRQGGHLAADPRLASVHHGDPATLRALFRSELWRGRDNLRVSWRGPWTIREASSIAVPVLTLACLAAIPSATILNPPMAAVAATIVVLLSSSRAIVIAKRVRPLGVVGCVRAFAVALTYDVARALALLLRTPHRRKRQPGATRAEGP